MTLADARPKKRLLKAATIAPRPELILILPHPADYGGEARRACLDVERVIGRGAPDLDAQARCGTERGAAGDVHIVVRFCRCPASRPIAAKAMDTEVEWKHSTTQPASRRP